MSELLDLQNKFQSYLLNTDTQIKKLVLGTEKVSTETRLDIYGYAYRSRLLEALVESYPVLQKYLGEEKFLELASVYINKFPSTFRSIRWFGNQLAGFLHDEVLYQQQLYLSELAELEWMMTLVFDAADSRILSLEDMKNISPEKWVNLKFTLHASVHRLDFSWNVIQIWQTITAKQNPTEPLKHESPVPWVFWRKDLTNRFCSLAADEAWAIDSVLKGLTFGEICEGLCQWHDEKGASLRGASLLKGWISQGIIVQNGIES